MRVPEAEAAFLRACEIARVQEAHLFELRGATELARLWADRGDVDKALGLLALIVGRLGEGHTPYIVEASRLRDSLATH